MIRLFVKLVLFILLTAALIALGSPTHGAQAQLLWHANPETNITGYEVLVGRAAGAWDRAIPTGNVTTHTVTGLDSASLYYFSVRAVDSTGLKSADAVAITHTTAADIPPLDRTGWTITTSSEETDGYASARAVDGDRATFWHTTWRNSEPLPPHYIKVGLPRRATLSAMRYLPRQDGLSNNGNVLSYEVELSDDDIVWAKAVTGTWANDAAEKRAEIGLRPARFVRLWGIDRAMATAEINLEGTYEPTTSITLTAGMESSVDMVGWTRLYTTEGPALNKQFFRLFFQRSDGQRVNATYTIEPKP